MNRRLPVLLFAMLPLAALTSCGHTSGSASHASLSIRGDAVHIAVGGAPPASIGSDGSLRIGGRIVALTASGRALAQHYYQDVLEVPATGKATRKAVAKLRGAIVGSLVSALWNDDSSIIKRAAHTGAADVKAHLKAVCARLQALETAQNALAAEQPAFMPYRVIRHSDVSDCLEGIARRVTVTHIR